MKPHEDMEGFNIAYDENAIDVFLCPKNVLPPDGRGTLDDDPCLVKVEKVIKAIIVFRQHTSNPFIAC